MILALLHLQLLILFSLLLSLSLYFSGQESTDNNVVITPDILKTLDTRSLQIVMAQAAAATAVNSPSSLSTTLATTAFSSPYSSSSSSSSSTSSTSSSLPIETNKDRKDDVAVDEDAKAARLSLELLMQQQQSSGGVLLLAQPPTAKLSDHGVQLHTVPARAANISSVLTSAAASSLAGSTPGPTVVCLAPMLLPALLNGIQLQQGGGSIGAAPALQFSNGGQLLTLLNQGLATTTVSSSSSSVKSSAAAPGAVLAATSVAGSPQLVLPIQLDGQSSGCLGTTPVLSLPPLAKGSGLDLLKLAQISQLDKTIATLNAGGVVKDQPLVPMAISTGSEVLQQLLDQSADGVKCTWNTNVKPTPTITTFSPVASGSLVNGTLSPVAQGTSPLVQSPFGRRKRSVFSGFQVEELEKHFQVCSYINAAERERLASKIGLSADQVKVWFQNRRTKKTRTSWRSKED